MNFYVMKYSYLAYNILFVHRMNQLSQRHKLISMRVQITVPQLMWLTIHLHQVPLQSLKKQYNQKQQTCTCMERPMIDHTKK